MKHRKNPHRDRHVAAQEEQMAKSLDSLLTNKKAKKAPIHGLVKAHAERKAHIETLSSRLERLREDYLRAKQMGHGRKMVLFKKEFNSTKEQLNQAREVEIAYRKKLEEKLRE